MYRRVLAPLLASLLPLACVADGVESDLAAPDAREFGGSPAVEGELPRGMYAFVPPEYEIQTAEPSVPGHIQAGQVLVYMNRDGGTFTVGANDARTNRSSIPNQTTTIAPWQVSDTGWQDVMSCVREIWAPYNVVITDQDPGNVPHFESVVAGHPNDVGMANGVGGVSPFTSNCSVIDNSIVFTFAEVYGSNYRAICETAAQEIAHSFGLDHEYLCEDPMTYLGGCGAKTFQNTAAPCGEDGPRECACGGTTQNSVQMLLDRIGPADEIAPDVTISRPLSGQSVDPGFVIQASVSGNVSIDRVELWIDGELTNTVITEPYIFNAPDDLRGGQRDVETRAIDNLGNIGSASVTVTLSGDGSGTDPGTEPGGTDGASGSDVIGGCRVTSGAGAAAPLLLASLGLLLVRRRRLLLARRRRH